jgi:hypothetical protein
VQDGGGHDVIGAVRALEQGGRLERVDEKGRGVGLPVLPGVEILGVGDGVPGDREAAGEGEVGRRADVPTVVRRFGGDVNVR